MDEFQYWMMDEDGFYRFSASTPPELFLDLGRRRSEGYVLLDFEFKGEVTPDLRLRPRPRREDA